MGLFVDKNSIPIRFNIFPGNRSEQISIDRQTFNEIHRKFKIGSFVYCADLQRRCLDEPPKASKNQTNDQEEFKPATWRYFSYDQDTDQYIEKRF